METLLKPQRSAKGETERRATIIQTAHQAFLADGYAGTSMSSIAAKLGGSKGTLYNHFASKEDLFVAVVKAKRELLTGYIDEIALGGGDFGVALKKLGIRFLQFVLGDESIATFRLVTAESGRFPELGQALYRGGFMEGIGKLSAFFDHAVETGDMRRCDTRKAAEQFFELTKSGMHHRRLWNVTPPPTDEEIAQHVAVAVDTFLRAYGAPA